MANEESETVDLEVIQLAALLHDIADWKITGNNDMDVGPQIAYNWVIELGLSEEKAQHIKKIIESTSFKGEGVKTPMKSLEGKIVQDADRLDALGAIGVARVCSFGGFLKREIHNPSVKPVKNKTFEQYKNDKNTIINHFYEKLLLLKDRMNTEPAKKEANKRHNFMCSYLDTFFEEWGKD